MIASILISLALIAVPIALFVAGGVIMMRATGRAQFRQRRSQPDSVPLNFRFSGYSAASARAYWNWLGPAGRAAELRFLLADMVFPAWYGGLMVASALVASALAQRPLNPAFVACAVALAVIADWVENLVHIAQLRRFTRAQPVQDGWMRLASLATSLKLFFFWLSVAGMVASALWVVLSRFA